MSLHSATINHAKIAAVLAVASALMLPFPVSACDCIERPPCGPHHYLDADFVGEILSSKIVKPAHEEAGNPFGWSRNHLQVRVVESFRGTQKTGEIVTLTTGLGGGDCGYRFKVGGKYLIDAAEKDGNFSTGICTLTAPLEQAEVELRALRNIAAGQRVPDLTGVLFTHPGQIEDSGDLPLPGIRVSLQLTSGGPFLQSTTDSLGAFTFPTLAPSSYRIALALPYNLSPAFTDFARLTSDQLPPLLIERSGAKSAGCHIAIFVGPSASVSGVVKAPDGKPIDGWVNADEVAPDGSPRNTVLTAWPSSDGVFRLAHLLPGRYFVQFTAREGFLRGNGQIVELKEGELKTDLVLTAR